jgi:hypothetical protein
MKPSTAAKKLGIYLAAAPKEFQDGELTRTAFLELQSNPPEWLAELRRTGPHPRPVVAQKLGVSISGLARGGADDALTTVEIKQLLETMPEWLVEERARQAVVRDEALRVKFDKAAKAELKKPPVKRD